MLPPFEITIVIVLCLVLGLLLINGGITLRQGDATIWHHLAAAGLIFAGVLFILYSLTGFYLSTEHTPLADGMPIVGGAVLLAIATITGAFWDMGAWVRKVTLVLVAVGLFLASLSFLS